MDAMAGWDIYPYEADSLRMQPIRPLLEVEPPRFGDDPAACWCADTTRHRTADTVWTDGVWRVDLDEDSGLPLTVMASPMAHCGLTTMPDEVATSMGPLLRTLAAAVEKLPSVGGTHVYKYGDGGAHLHLWILGRPARSGQFRG